uniref:Gag-Pol polyprotein n=1 Tax=Tanacetum cinerariifolium TaxID=118510 RepID=A0A6L2JA40_TANCI|nr:Gag-Pol polyprotein [Tanacetum cinerariifolium]
MKDAKASVASHIPSHKVTVMWHRNLRHVYEQRMKILFKRKLLLGLLKISLPFFEMKTPMEIWTGKPDNYSDLHIYGSYVYVMYNTQETMKLDPKFRICFLLGYAYEVKGYLLWDPFAHKVVVTRDVVFMEDKIHYNQENDRKTKETTSINMENRFNRMILLKLHLNTRESGFTVNGYVDSGYAGDLDGSKSTTRYVFTLAGETKVEEGTVDMQKIHTDDNVADYLTKAISCDKFI